MNADNRRLRLSSDFGDDAMPAADLRRMLVRQNVISPQKLFQIECTERAIAAASEVLPIFEAAALGRFSPRAAIDAAQAWIEAALSGNETQEKAARESARAAAHAAADAIYAAAHAAAHAARSAAYAAWAAARSAAYAAARSAAWAAAYAAHTAAYAAAYAARAQNPNDKTAWGRAYGAEIAWQAERRRELGIE